MITSLGEAWDGAIKAVEEGDMPHKDEALEIMRNTPENVIKDGKVVDTRKRQMMNLAGGTVWRYMIENPVAPPDQRVRRIQDQTSGQHA